MKTYQKIGLGLVSLGVLFLLMGTGVLILNKPSYVQAADKTKPTAIVSKSQIPRDQRVNDDSLGQTENRTEGRARKANKKMLEMLRKEYASHVLKCMESLETEKSSEARKEIILRLRWAQDDRATLLLCKVLEEDQDSGVREAAANALGSIGDKRAIPHLTRALRRSDEDTLVRIAVAINLFLLGEYKMATPFLKQFLKSENDSIRRQVVCYRGFGYLTGRDVPEVIPLLEIAIRDENPDIQICAAQELDEFDEMPRVYSALCEDLKSKNSNVRVKALYGLDAISLLEQYPRPGRSRFDVKEIKSTVKKMLKDKDSLVRETARKVLERMNSRAY